MKKINLIILFLFFVQYINAQVTAGELIGIHNVTTAEMNAITTPISGSLVYNTVTKKLMIFDGASSSWLESSFSSDNWVVTGNTGTTNTNFIGTTDAQDLIFRAGNIEKLRINNNRGQLLVNQAPVFNNHPLVVRANGNDVLAFQDSNGIPKWHWNLLSNGLNFVESNVKDYRLFLENGGNVGVDTSDPTERFHVVGNMRLTGAFKDSNNEAGTAGQVISTTVGGTDWVDVSSLETVTTIGSTLAVGHKIADYTNEAGGVAVDINETVTSLAQLDTSLTGEITFTDENGNTTGQAQVIGAETDNQISVGGNGGAYLGPTVYTGSFIISATGNKIIVGIPFEPSQVTFVAYANVESFNIDQSGSSANNIANSFGGMNGFVRNDPGGIVQGVIFVGGSGQSINNISRFSSEFHCIGLRYGNQDGVSLGKTTASLTSFTADGFILNVDNRADNVLVIYTAYR